jgi:N-acetylmuramoyl-L-alanine amidase
MRFRQKQCITALCAFLLYLVFACPALALKELPHVTLRVGSEGEAVRILQENLVELKLYRADVDGVYTTNTVSAVKKLQAVLGLPVDGICGLITIKSFNAALAQGALYPDTVVEETQKPLEGVLIGIDPGHQKTADATLEPIAPNDERTKERMSSGGVGVKTGIPEYETTLLVANKLKKALEDMGATVIVIRTRHDVNISNKERAEFMNKATVDFWVRIHCDFSNDKKLNGVRVLVPSEKTAEKIAVDSLAIAKYVLPAICEETGAKPLSITKKSDQTAFNWSYSPVITVELGYLSNANEDVLLNRAYYQQGCANGIANGLLQYHQSKNAA